MAQIVTITNPLTGQPAQVDQLEHTAQEIDDGIARALPGGAIDKALQNKAPAGQGYDGASSTMPSLYLASGTEAEFEALLDAKLATMAVGSTIQAVIYDPNIMAGFTGYGTFSLDSNYAGGFATLTCNFVVSSGVADIERQATIIKVKTRGVWYPWEWVNPPMLLGVEYRTTERYKGKPVYAKDVDCGAAPATGYTIAYPVIDNIESVIEAVPMVGSGTLPAITGSTANYEVIGAVQSYQVDNKYAKTVIEHNGNTTDSVIVRFRYTKTTG